MAITSFQIISGLTLTAQNGKESIIILKIGFGTDKKHYKML